MKNILLMCLCVLLMSCQTTTPTETTTYQLFEKDSGSIIEVNTGDEINITLPIKDEEYKWDLIGTKNTKFLNMTLDEINNNQQQISFKVVGEGNVLIVFNYRHPSERNQWKEFPSFTLIVRTQGIID